MAMTPLLTALAFFLAGAHGSPWPSGAPSPTGVMSPPTQATHLPSTSYRTMIDMCGAFKSAGMQISCASTATATATTYTPPTWHESVPLPSSSSGLIARRVKPRNGTPIMSTPPHPFSYHGPAPTGTYTRPSWHVPVPLPSSSSGLMARRVKPRDGTPTSSIVPQPFSYDGPAPTGGPGHHICDQIRPACLDEQGNPKDFE